LALALIACTRTTLVVDAVTPDAVAPGVSATVTVHGAGFVNALQGSVDDHRPLSVVDTWSVRVGAVAATSVARVDERTLTVVVPPLDPGDYDVVVQRPDGLGATLSNGLHVGGDDLGVPDLGACVSGCSASACSPCCTESSAGTTASNQTCSSGCSCFLSCTSSDTCHFTCAANTTCTASASSSNDVVIDCAAGSSCQLACKNDNNCTVSCNNAACLVSCGVGVINCNVNNCPTAVTICPGGVKVCGRPCP
jgi:hypothetical protein